MMELSTYVTTGAEVPASGSLHCPICGSTDSAVILDVAGVPVDVGYLWRSQEEAYRAPTGAIKLTACLRCGFVNNRAFVPGQPSYEPGYEVSLHHSALYRSFLRDTAHRLIDEYDLRRKSIVEIGTGKGIFLRLLSGLGANRCIGIDPCVDTEGLFEVGEGTIELIRAVYSEHYAGLESALVCCRHVLQHIPDPKAFLDVVRRNIGARADTVVYFEMPNAAFVFQQDAVWNVFYEHCSYFTPDVLAYLFRQSGFEVLALEPCYEDGQYVGIEAVPGRAPGQEGVPAASDDAPAYLVDFARVYRDKVAEWSCRLQAAKAQGLRVVAWGSGGRGITFLTTLKTRDLISYVVDINPDRHGAYVPSAGQQVVAPAFLITYQPDIVIITNPTYEREIREQVGRFGLAPAFLVA